MNHLVLVGDSIFDNAGYVEQAESVIELLNPKLPKDSKVSLLAVDGDVTSDVHQQLMKLPEDATHLFISCGGNDALRIANVLNKNTNTVGEAMEIFTEIKQEFQYQYRAMLANAKSKVKNITICTIYDSVPNIEQRAVTALALFNEVILREAFLINAPIIDLRIVCSETTDYSTISPIEPSREGGEKIATTINKVLNSHNFYEEKSGIYV